MDINEAINGRRSVRQYAGTALEESMINSLIGAANCAPSAINLQPWTFTVVRDQALLDRLSTAAKAHLLQQEPAAPHAEQFSAMLADPDFHIFYHAPVLILIAGAAPRPWIVEDCALAAENLMLAAYGAGLGNCWIGFAQGYLNTPEGKQMLDLPSSCVPIAPIVVGHPKSAPPVVARTAPVVRWIG